MSVASQYFDRVATRILEAQASTLPDLRHSIVLLPNYHVAQPMAQALMRCARRPALLLPQMLTLNDWASRVSLAAPIDSDNQRSALLYQLLKRKVDYFDKADLWSIAQELLQLFDELTYQMDSLPTDQAGFELAVQQAYRARQNIALQMEARLVFELWRAMLSGPRSDTARAYQQRLGILAAQAAAPLYVLRNADWVAVEQRFLDEYQQHAPLTVFDLREMQDTQERETATGLRFFAATSLEQEARAAAMQVRLWLSEGKREIAVVAQDRVVARRLRALLDRDAVMVVDETGWTLATLSVSTVLDRWLSAVQSDFYHHDLLDLLKSPYIFSELGAGQRKAAVYQLEQHLRQHSVVSGLARYANLARQESVLSEMLGRLRQAAEAMQIKKPKTLASWLATLQHSLAQLGISGGLQADEVGIQLLQNLATWADELSEDSGQYRFSEWRRWLAQKLDTETYCLSGIDSPIRFTHLAATRWRTFEGVILLGCEATNLPSVSDGGRWFNDSVRGSLRLPTRSVQAQRQRDDLHALLQLNPTVLVTWQAEKEGEQRLLSPYLQLIKDAREKIYHIDFIDYSLDRLLLVEDAQCQTLPPAVRPSPTLAKVPEYISVSAYNILVACPYQYFARYGLALDALDEVQDSIEKRDYGELVHHVLEIFHCLYAKVSDHPREEMVQALHALSEETFAQLLEANFEAHAWVVRWLKRIPAYLDWQYQSEAQGWCFQAAERTLTNGMLKGKIDRLDSSAQGVRVLDYKTQNTQSLRDKLREPGEDVQLACYAHAEHAVAASFVGLDDDKVALVSPTHDITALAELNAMRLQSVMQRLHTGAGLVANGIDRVCEHCDVQGLCRKGEW